MSDSNIPLMNRNFTQRLKTKVSLTFNGFLVCVYMSIGMWEGASLPHTCTPPHSHNLSAQSPHPFLAKVVCSMILSFTHSLARPPPLLLPPSLPPSLLLSQAFSTSQSPHGYQCWTSLVGELIVVILLLSCSHGILPKQNSRQDRSTWFGQSLQLLQSS